MCVGPASGGPDCAGGWGRPSGGPTPRAEGRPVSPAVAVGERLCLLQGKLALKKQPGPTLCRMAEILETVPVLWCQRLQDGRAWLQVLLLDRLLGRMGCNAAGARSRTQ